MDLIVEMRFGSHLYGTATPQSDLDFKAVYLPAAGAGAWSGVHRADLQNPDGGVLLMASLFGLFPFLLKLYADGGYQGPTFQTGLHQVCQAVNVEIVKRSDVGRFVVLPQRWIVERTIAWLNRCRRLAKDWERMNPNALVLLRWASIRLMVRKLCQTID
jgi:transposase